MPNHLAIYIRLSFADSKRNPMQIKDESESVSGQRALAHSFLDNHPEFADWTVHEYVDDGYTGTNDSRPQFQQMIRDIQNRLVTLIIVKDFSRFSRDYIMMGDYLEQIFPFLGVRFISINDHYDSGQNTDFSDSITVVLKSIMNSYYSRELSTKMSSAYRQKMYSDDYHGYPSYGYTRGADGRSLVPDPEAAKVVRRIFDLALEGMKPTQIADIFNADAIPTPKEYILKQSNPVKAANETKKYWRSSFVLKILRNRTYIGDLVMLRSVRTGPCSGHSRWTDSSEQVIRENDHESIVTREEFTRIQDQLLPKRIPPESPQKRKYILKAKVRCGLCGRKPGYEASTQKFRCLDCNIIQSPCFGAMYSASVIYPCVFSTIKESLPLILEEETRAAVRKAKAPETVKQISHDLQLLQDKKQELLIKKAELYEAYIAGNIPISQYIDEKHALNIQTEEIDTKSTSLQSEKESYAYTVISTELRKAAQAARKYSDAAELTNEMAEELIDTVYLFPDCLQIKWKYHALFERFAPESTGKIAYYKEEL